MNPREFLTALYEAAVAAVDPVRLVGDALGRRGDALYVRSSAPSHREFVFAPNRLAVLAVGKAAVPMARAAHGALGDLVREGLVLAPEDSRIDLPGHYRVIEAGHPHPTPRSVDAGAAALALAGRLGEGDVLLALLSGGGSSLMAMPAEAISLDDKARTAALLMAAGAPIHDVNLVRGALSRVKAGRLAAAAGLADVVSLVLSDTGDSGWHLVASGPTLGVPPKRADAAAVLETYRLTPLVPPAVRSFLLTREAAAPPRPAGNRWSVLLGDIRTAVEGARREALRLGADVRVIPELLSGEARSAARRLAVAGACAGNLLRRNGGGPARRLVTLFGGETTVTVKGSGRGGRCRELALATAFQIQGARGARALVAGTDGIDHEKDAAGAFVDDTTIARAFAADLDPDRALAENDTAPFFTRLGDAFAPGATGTNVGDVAFVLAPGTDPPAEDVSGVGFDDIPLPSLD